ncbi:hypothetical protein M426DRAFT_11836 [Hypoxylon sp. CI-4A]|nr:hypothetical protein M426DRAFT_11836 [Hypoxylon sp. CI-4A]
MASRPDLLFAATTIIISLATFMVISIRPPWTTWITAPLEGKTTTTFEDRPPAKTLGKLDKTWRLFITPKPRLDTCLLTKEALLSALEARFEGIDIKRLSLTAEPDRYCATVSLRYMESPFDTNDVFDLEVNTDGEPNILSIRVAPDCDFLHMTTLYDGAKDRGDGVDLIVVPNLAAHPFGSFKSLLDGTQNWLRDYLPERFPNLRILVYGYDSVFAGRKDEESVDSFATGLRSAIRLYRKGKPVSHRLIVFLGHSLGGLIIKQAESKGDTDSKIFLISCSGFLSFGVPNRGLGHKELAAMLGYNPPGLLAHDLVIEKDMKPKGLLRTLEQTFVTHFSQDFDTVEFFETEKTPVLEQNQDGTWKRATDEARSILMVARNPATLINGGPISRKQVSLQKTNHVTLVKYDTENDSRYRVVLGEIEVIISKAIKKKELSTEQRKKLDDFREKAQVPIHELPAFIDDPVPQTLQGFLEADYFTRWRDGEEAAPLWIRGPPGHGKSVLARRLVKHIEEHSLKSSRWPEGVSIIGYFCNAQGRDFQPADILRSLIMQLASYQKYYGVLPSNFWDSAKQFSDNSVDGLFEIFEHTLLKIPGRRVYCVIDALDECPHGDSHTGQTERSKLIEKLAKLFSENRDRMRLLVTSRPDEKDIEHYLDQYSQELEVAKHDLILFIDAKLEDLPSLNRVSRTEVRDRLVGQVGGTFLWVAIVTRELGKFYMPTPHDIEKVLKEIPVKLDKTYPPESRKGGGALRQPI